MSATDVGMHLTCGEVEALPLSIQHQIEEKSSVSSDATEAMLLLSQSPLW
ncbi:MAG: hypothetical protein R3C05_19460 [Pirellulaceae bacterium]